MLIKIKKEIILQDFESFTRTFQKIEKGRLVASTSIEAGVDVANSLRILENATPLMSVGYTCRIAVTKAERRKRILESRQLWPLHETETPPGLLQCEESSWRERRQTSPDQGS